MGFLEIAAAIASAGYTGYKLWRIISEMLESRQATKWQIISRVVNAAVNSVYNDFVRTERDKNEGKLSTEAKSKARNMAHDRVLKGLRAHNLKASELKPDEILDLVEESVMAKQARATFAGKDDSYV